MDADTGIFKISKTSYIFTSWLEKNIRNKIFFLDWCSGAVILFV